MAASIHHLEAHRQRSQSAGADSAEGPSDAELIAGARAGHSEAVEALYHRYVRKVSGLAYRIAGHSEDLDDIVQETFVAALDGLPRLQDPQAFSKWIGAITIRTTQRWLSRRRLRERFGLAGASASAAEIALSASAPPDAATALRQIYAVVQQLPTKDRVAFLLRRVEGYTNDQVADALGISLATAKRRIARAQKRVAQMSLTAVQNKEAS